MQKVFRQSDGPQLRIVGLFGALSCPPETKVATKNEPCGYHCLPHVFLAAVMGWFSDFHLYLHLANLKDRFNICIVW